MTEPDFALYPDEQIKVARVLSELGNQFEFTTASDTDRTIFEMAANNEFGRIGLRVRINWERIYYPDGTPSPVMRPGIEPYGRTKGESERDHDRVQWGVVKGLEDGQPGYIREDGTKHEEPRKKDIL